MARLGVFTFADRNRFEKLVGFGTSPGRYRNRFLVDRPFGAHDHWHLFADVEVIFDVSAGEWSQNRAQAGDGALLNRRLLLDVYFLQRNAGGPAPTTRVLGTTLRVRLTPRVEGHAPDDTFGRERWSSRISLTIWLSSSCGPDLLKSCGAVSSHFEIRAFAETNFIGFAYIPMMTKVWGPRLSHIATARSTVWRRIKRGTG